MPTRRIPPEQLVALEARVDPVRLAELLQRHPRRAGARFQAHCPQPSHGQGDRNPSLVIYPDEPTAPYHCFGCGWHPRPIAFVRACLPELGFLETVRWLAEQTGFWPDGLPQRYQPSAPATVTVTPLLRVAQPTAKPALPMPQQQTAVALALRHLLAVEPTAAEQGRAYLTEQRGLPPAVLAGVPAYHIASAEMLAAWSARCLQDPAVELLTQAGIVVPATAERPAKLVWWDAGVLLGSTNRDGQQVLALRLRRQHTSLALRMRYVAQHHQGGARVVPAGLVALRRAVEHHQPLLIMEGGIDALTSWAYGIPAIAMNTRPGFARWDGADQTQQAQALTWLVEDLRRLPVVGVLPDNDPDDVSRATGHSHALLLVRWLRQRHIRARLITLPDLGLTGKDLNAAWCAGQRTCDRTALQP
jgi:hypothetical protein